MKTDFDIAVVGSGFGGSLIAMIARQLGRSVILIERGRHPRFAIGESSTPLANLLLEEIARDYRLDALLPLTKWGTWQAIHPELACGLKRGFTFYHHQLGKLWKADELRRNELLVAASPHDRIADTHWYRADVDHFFVREAQRLGAEFIDRTDLSGGAKSWARLTSLLPMLQAQFARAKPMLPFFHMPKVPFRAGQAVGPRWAMLPSAAGSIDPLLSTGFPLTLWGVKRLAKVMEEN